MSIPRIAIGYLRVSTPRQAEQGVSLDVQGERIEEHCRRHGWRLANTFSDEGLSGRSAARRPAVNKAIAKVTAVHGVLVTYSLSRLARSVIDTYEIAKRLDAAKADLSSVTEPIDTTTSMGKAFFGLLAVFAQLESDQTSERVRAAIAHCRAQRGFNPTGTQPYGWRMSGGERVAVPEEQAVRSLIVALRGEGRQLKEIAAELDARHIPTPRRQRGYRHATQQWRYQTVWKILRHVA